MSSFLGNDTKFFYSLTPEIIDSALESIGIRPVGRTIVLNSLENRVYSVEVKTPLLNEDEINFFKAYDKEQVVVKFYRPGRWSADAINEEHESLNYLKEHELTIVSPLEIKGETFFKEKTTDLFFAVFPRVIGRLKDEINLEEAQLLGRLMGRVHGALAQLLPYKHRGQLSSVNFIDHHIDHLEFFDLAPKSLKTSFLQIAKNLKPYIDIIIQNLAVQRIHGDVHRGNVMWSQHGPFLMDFDDSLQGPIEQDLWLMVPGMEEEDLLLKQKFIEGYESMSSKKLLLTSRVIESLRTLRMIRFVGWIAKRYDDPFFQKMFPHFLTDGFWEQQVLALKEQWALLSVEH